MSQKWNKKDRPQMFQKWNKKDRPQMSQIGGEKIQKMAKRRTRFVKNKINRVLEVPDEVALKVPKLTILKFEEVLIENYKGILEYQDFFVRIQTYMGIININGFKLTLEEMTIDDLLVKGQIESIDFESIVDNEE